MPSGTAITKANNKTRANPQEAFKAVEKKTVSRWKSVKGELFNSNNNLGW